MITVSHVSKFDKSNLSHRYVGRIASLYREGELILGNPFKIGQGRKAADVVELFRAWLWQEIKRPHVRCYLRDLPDGTILHCHCKEGSPCHADVIARAAMWLRSEQGRAAFALKEPTPPAPVAEAPWKAISVRQPYASLIMAGLKKWDTREWPTDYRGKLLIHVSRTTTERELRIAEDDQVAPAIRRLGFASLADMPRGCFLGTVELTGCHRVDSFLDGSCTEMRHLRADADQDGFELACGWWDVEGVEWALSYENPQPWATQPLWRGQQFIWEIPAADARRLMSLRPAALVA